MPKKVTLADREKRADAAGFRPDTYPRDAQRVLRPVEWPYARWVQGDVADLEAVSGFFGLSVCISS